MGVDVARSDATSNNKTAIVVIKIIRNLNNKITQLQVVNIVEPKNGLTFKEQSIVIKKLFYKYGGNINPLKSRVKAIVIDGNGLGKGLVDRMGEDVSDPETNKELGAFDIINSKDNTYSKNPKLIYNLISTGINGDIITNFIDQVDSEVLKLLTVSDDIKKHAVTANFDVIEETQARINTQALVDEISNLKLKKTTNSQTVEQVLRKIDKDKYSALAYGLYYIKLFLDFEDEVKEEDEEDREYVIY